MLGSLVVVPVLLTLLASSSQATAGARDEYFDSAGVRIRYFEEGQGELVILIHGLTGLADGWTDAGLVGDLSKSYHVVALDLRGHGRSDKPASTQSYGREMAMDVVRLMDHLKVERAHLVGYSLGAQIAGIVAIEHPSRVLSATLAAGTPKMSWTPADAAAAERGGAEGETGRPLSLVRNLMPAGGVAPDEAFVTAMATRLMENVSPASYAAIRRAAVNRVLSEAAWSSAKVPMQSIQGTRDPSIGSAQAALKLLPSLKLVVVSGATHVGDRWEWTSWPSTALIVSPEFRSAVLAFIRANSGNSTRPA